MYRSVHRCGYYIEAEELDGENVTFSLEGDLAGLSESIVKLTKLDRTTAKLEWFAPAAGTTNFIVVAIDERGASSRQSIRFAIEDSTSDVPPTITSTPVFTVIQGEAYTYQVTATDPDGPVTFALDDAPTGMTIDPVTGLITWDTTAAPTGPVDILISAAQGSAIAYQGFVLTVGDPIVNNAPVIQPAAGFTAVTGMIFTYQVVAARPQ